MTELAESLQCARDLIVIGEVVGEKPNFAASGRYERLEGTNKKLMALSQDQAKEDPESRRKMFNASLKTSAVIEMGKVSQIPESTGKPLSMSGNEIDEHELLTELRHKYITILKSLYWEYFEGGQCNAASVRVLIESADRALDHED